MTNRLSQKDINDLALQALAPEFEKRGYQQYRGKQFLRISGGILRYVGVYPNKNDAYVWHGAFPLCQHDLWLGWSASGGRFPKKVGGLTVPDMDSMRPAIDALRRAVIKSLRILNRHKDAEHYAAWLTENDSPYRALALAYCLASVGDVVGASNSAMRFLDEGKPNIKTVVSAEALIEAVEDGEVADLLRQTTEDNIRRLRLRRYLPQQ